MSYSVMYDPELHKRYPIKKGKVRRFNVKKVIMFVIAIAVIFIAIQYNLMYYVLPGDPAVTAGATQTLLEDIRAGEPVKKAINCFVETVLSDEN